MSASFYASCIFPPLADLSTIKILPPEVGHMTVQTEEAENQAHQPDRAHLYVAQRRQAAPAPAICTQGSILLETIPSPWQKGGREIN